MSRTEEDKIMPLKPPSVNKKRNPITQKDRIKLKLAVKNDTAQLKTLTPVGTAIIIVAAVKYPRVSTSILTVNIWCAHTTQPNPPIDSIEKTIPNSPKSLNLFVLIKIELEITPKAGKIKI